TDSNALGKTQVVLLLALACPNFDYMAVGKKHRELFMKAMQEIIAEPEFSHDAS
ncbi:hypothetical protein GGI19_006106, partial [Coemansia pectinata]